MIDIPPWVLELLNAVVPVFIVVSCVAFAIQLAYLLGMAVYVIYLGGRRVVVDMVLTRRRGRRGPDFRR